MLYVCIRSETLRRRCAWANWEGTEDLTRPTSSYLVQFLPTAFEHVIDATSKTKEQSNWQEKIILVGFCTRCQEDTEQENYDTNKGDDETNFLVHELLDFLVNNQFDTIIDKSWVCCYPLHRSFSNGHEK